MFITALFSKIFVAVGGLLKRPEAINLIPAEAKRLLCFLIGPSRSKDIDPVYMAAFSAHRDVTVWLSLKFTDCLCCCVIPAASALSLCFVIAHGKCEWVCSAMGGYNIYFTYFKTVCSLIKVIQLTLQH